MKPTEPTRPDGRGGVLDADGRHWFDLDHQPDWYSNPIRQTDNFIKSGDIIETSMQYWSTQHTTPVWNVFHHRVTLTFPTYSIQAFANGMMEEWIDALKQVGANRHPRELFVFTGLTNVGPAVCRNLSNPTQEATSVRSHVIPLDSGNGPDSCPLRTAAVVTKHTQRVTRGGTGRFLMPYVPEVQQSSGGLTALYTQDMVGLLSDVANYVDASITGGATAIMALYHQTASKKTGTVQTSPVTHVSIKPRCGSLRSRQVVRA